MAGSGTKAHIAFIWRRLQHNTFVKKAPIDLDDNVVDVPWTKTGGSRQMRMRDDEKYWRIK